MQVDQDLAVPRRLAEYMYAYMYKNSSSSSVWVSQNKSDIPIAALKTIQYMYSTCTSFKVVKASQLSKDLHGCEVQGMVIGVDDQLLAELWKN